MSTEQLQLPYMEITAIAGRDTRRDKAGTGQHTFWVDFSTIHIRDGFNLRKDYKEIPELSLYIEFNGVPGGPLTVDMLQDGQCPLEIGHRRYKAIVMLLEKFGGDVSLLRPNLPGIRVKEGALEVECFINDNKVDELTRLKRQFTSNNGEKYTSLEMAELCWRMEKFFNLNPTDIARELGMSRQQINNYLIIAGQSDQVKQAIGGGTITPTAAVNLARKLNDADKVTEKVEAAVASGNKISVSDVQRLEGEDAQGNTKGSKDELGETFDEGREEIRWCQNVIKLLDKIGTKVSKIDNDQLKGDIEKNIEWAHKDMELIRNYIKKNKKR